MKTAAYEKDRLENRQRAYRRYYQGTGKEHRPRYFKIQHNQSDDQDYWVYNNLYFEHDRPKQDWSNLPDIFGLDYPEEVQPYVNVKGTTKH